ncbi:MAG TPA: hypothetical protein VNA14_00805 [Mycobacteriales bacterium]|nr:hypothetical protein [Mycobacteriales bacterium]
MRLLPTARSTRRRGAAVLAAAAALATVTPGWAHPLHTVGTGPRGLGYEVVGILPVDLPPGVLAPAEGSTAPGSNARRYAYDIPRSLVDRPDGDVDGRLVHVIYYLPADKPDEGLDTSGVIDVSIAAQQKWIAAQTGGRTWRFDTFGFDTRQGRRTAYDVTFFRSTKTTAEVSRVEGIDAELIAAGLVQDGKRYLIYAATDTGNICGEAYYPISTNSDHDGQFAAVYLDSVSGCAARDFATSVDSAGMVETIAQQEIMHNDGVVPITAGHQCLPGFFHVCTAGLAEIGVDPQRFDILFPYVGVPLREKVLDIGRDDYFEAPTALRDLANSPFLT